MRTSKYLKPDSTHAVTSTAGSINVHVFEPKLHAKSASDSIRGTIVTVHPWSALGGGEHNTIGIARHIAHNSQLSEQKDSSGGWRVITFPLKSAGAVWGICSNHSYEVQQTVDVVNWVSQKYGSNSTIVLLGSSAGAPIAGTAMAQLLKQEEGDQTQRNNGNIISAYVAVGYTFGRLASLGFGRHFSSVLGRSDSWFGSASSTNNDTALPPKLFIMGERDEFTSVSQLEQMALKMRANNGNADVEIVADVGHFELESSSYDPMVAKMVVDWLDKVFS